MSHEDVVIWRLSDLVILASGARGYITKSPDHEITKSSVTLL
jgi:hypothetical protein